jgi:hypothetical protein
VTTVSSPTPIPSPAATHPDSGGETHYVLVIHGTFSAIEAGKIKWFQLDEHDPDNFCHQLNERLARTPLGRAVWRNPMQVFSWSGENGHAERLRAAKELCGVMTDLVRRDPRARIHLVAHSHGGNVVLKAIELYYDTLLYRAFRLSTALQQSILMAGEGEGGDPIDEAFHRAFPNATTGPPEALKELLRGLAESLRSEISTPIPLGAFYRRLHGFNDRRRLIDFEWSVLEMIEKSPDVEVFFDRVSDLSLGVTTPKSFARTWVNSRVSNRLGRVVFLGTPFFRKRWVFLEKGRVPGLDYVLHNLYILPAAALGPLIIIYASIISIMSVVYVLRLVGHALGLAAWPPGPHYWDPTGWPAWLSGASVLVALVLGANALTEYYLFYNTNFYLDVRTLLSKLWIKRKPDGKYYDICRTFNFDRDRKIFVPTTQEEFRLRKVPALVVTAPCLDEALLALSAEPIVYANLVPRIEELLYHPRELRALRAFRRARPPERWARMVEDFLAPAGSDRRAGVPAGRVNQDIVQLFWLTVLPRKIMSKIVPLVIKAASVVIYVAVWFLWVPLRAVLKPYLTSTLVKAVSSAAFGLPASELRGARIEVLGDLDHLSEVFEAKPLDVSDEVLRRERERTPGGRAMRPEAVVTGGAGRYAYLVDAAELKRKRDERERADFDLRLMSAVDGVSHLPVEGKNLVVVAAVDHVLHFRIFDGDGKMAVDTDEKRLTERARTIAYLRDQLESLWPPHELGASEKGLVIAVVTSIVGYTRHAENAWQRILRSTPVLYRRDRAGAEDRRTREQYEDDLARAWFTLEERAKEAFGAVELIHSLYYTNPTVIDEISKFLAEDSMSERVG